MPSQQDKQNPIGKIISITKMPSWTGAVVLILGVLLVAAGCWFARPKPKPKPVVVEPKPITRKLQPKETAAVLGAKPQPPRKSHYHPPHEAKVWLTTYKGRTYRVTQLPRCEHLETIISYDPRGQTLSQARKRLGGVAASTGSFHNPQSMILADFLQRKGSIMCPATTGRCFVLVDGDGALDISGDYSKFKGDSKYDAIALGQRLVPLHKDGFTTAFMNEITDRMAVGLNKNFIFIVQGKTSIWRLSEFMQTNLPITSAINCDGGHVVRGKGPVHLVFRWRKK